MSMQQQVKVIGIEVTEGNAKATGKAYSIGRLHTITKLAPPTGMESNIAKGFMGDVYSVDAALLRPVAHLPMPFEAVATFETVMKFGKREQVVIDLRPVAVEKKAG